MIAFFLTAGLATRFRPYSLKTPKPLIPFWGAPLLSYTYEFMQEFPVDTSIFNLHHLPEKTKKGVLDLFKDKNLIFSLEEKNILGSGGAVLKAREFLEDDFFLVNGDEVFFPKNKDYLDLVLEHKKENRLATFLVMDHERAGKDFGAIWVDESSVVRSIGKKSTHPNSKPMHYIGVALLSPKLFQDESLRDCNILYDIISKHLGDEKIKVKHIAADWFEMGNPKDFFNAHQEIAANWQYYQSHPLFQKVQKKYVKDYQVHQKEDGFLVNQSSSMPKNYKGFCFLGEKANGRTIDEIRDSICYSEPQKKTLKDELLL